MKDAPYLEIIQNLYQYKIRDTLDSEHVFRVIPLLHRILVAVIDYNKFQTKGVEYLQSNAEDISMDTYFMLSQITKNISKLIGHNMCKQFKECIPSSSKYKMNELNNESA